MCRRLPQFPTARLDALVEEAIVDAHGDDEQTMGFLACIGDELELPVPDPMPAGWEWIEAFRRWAGPA